MNVQEAKAQLSNYRDKPFREHQKGAIDYILNSDKRWVILEAPTGSGKSLIAMVAGVASSSLTYATHSKVLQTQIVEDFPEAKSLFGRSNYPCLANPNLTCDECFHSDLTVCNLKSNCTYEKKKREILASKLKILNYDYLLTEMNYVGKFSGAPFLVIDEADNLENTLINFVTLTFTEYAINRLGISAPARKTAKAKDGISSWKDFGEMARERIKPIIRKLSAETETFKEITTDYQRGKIKEKVRIARLLEKVNLFLNNVDDTWIFDNSDESKYIFRPLWLTPELAENFLWHHGRKWVLMSASFLPTTILAKTLGMDPSDMDYLCLPSIFPPERRPIHILPVANLTAKTMATEVPKLIEKIKDILLKHPNERGLIHTVSYKLCNQIMEGVDSPRLITHNGQNRQEVLQEFMESTEPLVLISPSMERGVSLEMDLCRFIICAKAPFLSLGDKIVSARVYGGPIGNLWYAATMMLTVLQMTGRGFRSAEDFCVSYILDEQFSRVLTKRPSLLPNWWKEAIT